MDFHYATVMRERHDVLPIVAIVLFMMLSGCSVPPSKNAVKEVITHHLASNYFRVTGLVIGDMQKIPSAETKAGYLVNVPSLTIEFTKDMDPLLHYKKGHHLTYHNVRFRMERTKDADDAWIITNISGLPLME